MTPEMQTMIFNEAQRRWKYGTITNEQFNEYCYEYRNLTFRYSELGQSQAREHARLNNLPIAYSDRAID